MSTLVGLEVCMMHASDLEVHQNGESGTLVPSHIRTLGGIPVPVVILGDPAYPLFTWLLKPYQRVGLSDKQKKFNRRLSRARVMVECPFERLKSRWRSLLQRKDIKLDYLLLLLLRVASYTTSVSCTMMAE